MSFLSSINNISFPAIPDIALDAPAIEHSVRSASENFLNEVSYCFENLEKCFPKTKEEIEQKKEKLKELSGLIKRYKEKYPKQNEKALSTFLAKIKQSKDELASLYQTSRFVAMTEKGFHVQTVDNRLGVQPLAKINLKNIKATLGDIEKSETSFQKVRLLQTLMNDINDALLKIGTELSEGKIDEDRRAALTEQSAYLKKSLQQVLHYADFSLKFEEKLNALNMIREGDEFDKALSKMADPWGINFAQLSLKNISSIPELALHLSVLLKDRYYRYPAASPADFLSKWPKQAPEKYTDVMRKQALAELAKIQNNKLDDAFTNLTLEYLSNLLDPTGSLRMQPIIASKEKRGAKSLQIARVMNSVRRNDKNAEELLMRKYCLADKPLVSPPASFQDFMQSRSLSKKEIAPFVEILKAESAQTLLGFDFEAYCKNPEKFVLTNQKFFESFGFYINKMIAESKTPQLLLPNLALLALELASNGEFDFSYQIFMKMDKDQQALKEYKKGLNNLNDLLSPTFRKMREFLRKRAKNNELCFPYIPLINKDWLGYKESISRCYITQEEVEETLGESNAAQLAKIVQKQKQLSKHLEQWSDNELYETHLMLQNLDKLQLDSQILSDFKTELEDSLKNVTEAQLKQDKLFQQLHTSLCALKVFFRGYVRSDSTQKLIDAINSCKA